MNKISLVLKGESATEKLGALLSKAARAHCLELPHAVCINLEGDLGAGKTTFSRGFIRSLGFDGIVRSPTFTLVEPYSFGDFEVYHFDLYRLEDPEELEYMGVRDYFSKRACCLVEWPSKAEGRLPKADITICFAYGKNERSVVIESDLLTEKEFDQIQNEFNEV